MKHLSVDQPRYRLEMWVAPEQKGVDSKWFEQYPTKAELVPFLAEQSFELETNPSAFFKTQKSVNGYSRWKLSEERFKNLSLDKARKGGVQWLDMM